MSYSTALSQLRRCLATYTRLEVADVRKFALHSLKTTPLTWGLQLQLRVEVRAAQGHHRVRNSSGCVEKYRRDDVLAALRCQRSIVRAVQNGWVPCTALARGLVAVQEQDPRELLLAGHCELESDTEAEAESDDPDLDGLDASDADSVQSDALSVASEPEGDVLDYQGPWILNVATGWFHRSVQCESADSSCMLQYDGRIIGKACRPSSALGDHYEVRLLDFVPAATGHALVSESPRSVSLCPRVGMAWCVYLCALGACVCALERAYVCPEWQRGFCVRRGA